MIGISNIAFSTRAAGPKLPLRPSSRGASAAFYACGAARENVQLPCSRRDMICFIMDGPLRPGIGPRPRVHRVRRPCRTASMCCRPARKVTRNRELSRGERAVSSLPSHHECGPGDLREARRWPRRSGRDRSSSCHHRVRKLSVFKVRAAYQACLVPRGSCLALVTFWSP